MKDFHIGHRHKPLPDHLPQRRQRAANLLFGVDQAEPARQATFDQLRRFIFLPLYIMVAPRPVVESVWPLKWKYSAMVLASLSHRQSSVPRKMTAATLK